MFDWGKLGRDYYRLRVLNFKDLERWLILHRIDVDYIDKEKGNSYTLENQLSFSQDIFQLDSFWIDCAEPRNDGGEARKLHEFYIITDVIF
jgi:hypothetical protein